MEACDGQDELLQQTQTAAVRNAELSGGCVDGGAKRPPAGSASMRKRAGGHILSLAEADVLVRQDCVGRVHVSGSHHRRGAISSCIFCGPYEPGSYR